MKKMLTIMLAGVLMLAVSGCGAEPQHKVSYVVWLFELDDDSTVSVELSGGEKVEIPLTEE